MDRIDPLAPKLTRMFNQPEAHAAQQHDYSHEQVQETD
jgi:hypothetical protein